MPETVLISAVTPVYAGEDYLRELVEALASVRQEWQEAGAPMKLVEAIFVDDGSVDASKDVLSDLAKEYTFVTILELSRNFGQHPATVAGVLHTSGDWVVTLDEDLQHHPRHIVALLRRAVEGRFDVVYAKPAEAVHESKFRDWSSRAFKSLMARAARNPFIRDFNSYRMARGSVARAAAAVSSHATYFDTALCWFTHSVGTLTIAMKDDRFVQQNSSGYSPRKLLSHARRLLISSQSKWLRSGAFIGAGALAGSLVIGLIVVLQKVIAPESIQVRGWSSLFVMILFFGGLTTVLLGMLLEYLSTVVLHSQGKPSFFVVERAKDEVLREYFGTQDRDAAAENDT